MDSKSFIIHKDSLGILDCLTDEQAGKLFKAIRSYQDGDDLSIDEIIKLAFFPFKAQFDRDKEKYEKICNRNRTNGLKGGRPISQKTQSVIDNPKKADSKKDNDNDNDSKKDNVNKEKKNGRFAPPSLTEIKEYIKGKNYNVDSDIFFSHYDETNWFRGKVKMKCWKKTLHTWHLKNNKEDSGSNGKKYNGSMRFPRSGDCNAWVSFALDYGIRPKTGEQQYEFEIRVKRGISEISRN